MMVSGLTISSGQSLSGSVSLANLQVVALVVPSTWTAGAKLTFMLSADNMSYYPMSDIMSDQVFSIPAAPGTWIPIRTDVFPKDVWLKIQAGSPDAPVVQSTNQVFTLVTM